MRLLALDRKKGSVKLTTENVDDLWHLYNVTSEEDVVYAKTTREIKTTEEGARPRESRRVNLTLGLKVKEVFFDRNSSRLRIRGVIVEAPERYEGLKGSFHTISASTQDTLTIVKEKWSDFDLRRIKNACEVKTLPVIVTAIDDEEACIGVLGRFGVDVKFEKRLRLPGKLEADKRRDAVRKYFAEVSQALQEVWKSTKGQTVIVGPGFIKNDLAKYLEENLKFQPPPKIHVGFASSSGIAGINEALRSGALSSVIKENRVLQEVNLVERFLAQLASQRRNAAYGVEEVEAATKYGAVETLMVVDKHLRESVGEERLRLEEAMRDVEKKRGKIFIISSEHEGGEKVMSLGGVAAILRFAV